MAIGGVLGNGVKVAFSASSPVSWTRVGQLLDQQLPTLETAKVDKTTHGSSKLMRSMPGMISVGDLQLTILGDLDETTGASLESLRTYQLVQTTIWFRFEVPVDRSQSEVRAVEFQGYVGSFNYASPLTDRQVAEVAIVFDDDSWVMYNAGASAIT